MSGSKKGCGSKQLTYEEVSGEEAESLCRCAILELHRDRILGRLGSKKAKGQQTMRTPVNLAGRVGSLLRQIRDRQVQGKDGEPTGSRIEAGGLVEQLSKVEKAVKIARATADRSSQELAALQDVLESAYALVHRKEPLVPRLQRLGAASITQESREIRQLHALANYHRIITYLPKVSGGQHSALFRSITLNVLPKSSGGTHSGQKLIVHAEIQILIHFELAVPAKRPRFIAASKKPCYLCYCFIRAHRVYSVGGSHGEVYKKWTVRDRPGLCEAAQKRLNAALRRTGEDVARASKASRKAKVKDKLLYLQPLQTVSKLVWNASQNSSVSGAGVRTQLGARIPVAASSARDAARSAVKGAHPLKLVEAAEIQLNAHSGGQVLAAEAVKAQAAASGPHATDPNGRVEVVPSSLGSAEIPGIQPGEQSNGEPSSLVSEAGCASGLADGTSRPASPTLSDSGPTGTFSTTISPNHPAEFRSPHLNLFFHLDDPPLEDSVHEAADAVRWQSASCRVSRRQHHAFEVPHGLSRVDVDDLLADEVVLHRPEDSGVLQIVLKIGAQEYLVELSWLDDGERG